MAVFAWMAYKYAIDSYIKQQNAKTLWIKKYDLITDILKCTFSFTTRAQGVFYNFNRLFEDNPEVTKSNQGKLGNDFINFQEDINLINDEIDNLRKITMKHIYIFPELNMLGVSKEKLNEIREIMQKVIRGANEYQKKVSKYSDISNRISSAISMRDDDTYKQEIDKLKLIDTDPYKIILIDEGYNKLTKLGRELLGINP